MKRVLLSVFVSVLLLISGCGAPSESEIPEQESPPVETEAVEEAPKEEPIPEKPATEEPVSQEPEPESPTTEEPIPKEPEPEKSVTKPKPTPAKFVLTNLQAIPTPDLGEMSYGVSVDIQNTGGLRGVYTIMSKFWDEQMEPIEIELNPGQKKTVTLSEAQAEISSVAMIYKRGWIKQKEHPISAGDLSLTVTFPELDYKLHSTLTTGESLGGFDGEYLIFKGRVKNISDESIKDVEVVVIAQGYSDRVKVSINSSALIKHNPILPGQTSSFEVKLRLELPETYQIFFRFLNGDTIPTEYN